MISNPDISLDDNNYCQKTRKAGYLAGDFFCRWVNVLISAIFFFQIESFLVIFFYALNLSEFLFICFYITRISILIRFISYSWVKA